MKKLFLMAAAAATLFASCAKEETGVNTPAEKGTLTIRISGAASEGTRAVGAPGVTGQLATMTNGYVFLIDQLGAVIGTPTTLDPAQAVSGSGQVIPGVPSDARVYILGNTPADVRAEISNINTLAKLQAAASAITATANADYKSPAMANENGTPVQAEPTATDGQFEASVTVRPLYSRIELTEVKGGPSIVSFKVAGVYLDKYYSSFTMGGGVVAADLHEQGQDDDFTGIFGNNAGWTATGTASTGINGAMVATAGGTDVWNYHVGPGGKPVFIIHLTEIEYMKDYGVTADPRYVKEPLGERYLTVTGYNETLANGFARGKIYKVGAITFNETQTGITPNPTNVDLTVDVTVEDWIPENLTPAL
jgi:hypothetical protein